MTISASDYIDLGLRGIVILSDEWREEKSGYQPEHTDQVIACRNRDGQPCRMSFSWLEKFMPYNKSHHLNSAEPMDEADYAKILAVRGGPIDSPEVRAQIEASRAQAPAKRATPRCPTCGAAMKLRNRRADGKAFYGCSAYPGCKGSRPA